MSWTGGQVLSPFRAAETGEGICMHPCPPDSAWPAACRGDLLTEKDVGVTFSRECPQTNSSLRPYRLAGLCALRDSPGMSPGSGTPRGMFNDGEDEGAHSGSPCPGSHGVSSDPIR